MTVTALVLILAAAVLHAFWNLLAKQTGGGAVLVWLYGTVSTLLLTPLALTALVVERPSLGLVGLSYTLASALIHVAYYLVLQRGYQLGDLSLVYPLARGTGPVLSTIAAVLWLGERPSPLALGGSTLIALSVFALARPPRRSAEADDDADANDSAASKTRQAVGFGLLTGFLIAGYTLCDKQAVSRYQIPPLVQQWGTSLVLTVLLAPTARRRHGEVAQCWNRHRRAVVAIGVLVPTAYIMVLAAMSFTPVSYIAPAREIGILVGAFMGARLLSEGQPATRLAAAAAMLLGLTALALG